MFEVHLTHNNNNLIFRKHFFPVIHKLDTSFNELDVYFTAYTIVIHIFILNE